MFSKLLVLAAACVAVNSQSADEVQTMQAQHQKAADNLMKQLSATQHGMDMLENGMKQAYASTHVRMGKVAQDYKKTQAVVADVKSFISKIPAGDTYTNQAAAAAALVKKNLLASLKSKLGSIKSEYKTKIANENQPMGSTGLFTKQAAIIAAKKNEVDKYVKESAALNECNKKKQFLSDGKCQAPVMPTNLNMERIWHNLWTNDDSRNGGYVNNREITFTKMQDDTYIRVMYYDNMRVHGHTSHAMWETYVCDANGGGCSRCQDPGRMMHWRWSGHQHNWWVNNHSGGTMYGICKKTDNRALVKGTYKLRVYLHENRYDIHTGHSGQQGSYMVDEVLKV